MNLGKQLSVMAGQFRACFTSDKLLWARILLFIIFGLWGVMCFFIIVALFGFVQRMFGAIGDELDFFVKDEKRSPLVRTAMLMVASPISIFRYVFVPFFTMFIYIFNFLFNAFAYIVSLGQSGWHGSLQYDGDESTASSH